MKYNLSPISVECPKWILVANFGQVGQIWLILFSLDMILTGQIITLGNLSYKRVTNEVQFSSNFCYLKVSKLKCPNLILEANFGQF